MTFHFNPDNLSNAMKDKNVPETFSLTRLTAAEAAEAAARKTCCGPASPDMPTGPCCGHQVIKHRHSSSPRAEQGETGDDRHGSDRAG
jgi:hypothetical protein